MSPSGSGSGEEGTWRAVEDELRSVIRDFGPNLGRLNDNDFELVASRLSKVAARAEREARERLEGRHIGVEEALDLGAAVEAWKSAEERAEKLSEALTEISLTANNRPDFHDTVKRIAREALNA